MTAIHLDDVSKAFHTRTGHNQVLDKITCTIRAGEVVAIRGDNGTGKTTLLNIIAGLQPPSSGRVRFVGLTDTSLRMGFTQQDYSSSLLPWFDVLDNVAIPLRLTGVPKSERRRAAHEHLESIGFATLPRQSFPNQLSGGQKQRVAIARALIHRPHVLLLDEPFANLDAHTTRDLQETLLDLHSKNRYTVVLISHELDHCVYLADRILLLSGRPGTIYGEFPIQLQRPRRREMLTSHGYTEVRAKILAAEEAIYGSKA